MVRIAIILVLVALVTAACSDDGGESAPTVASAPETTAAPATTEAVELLTGPLQVGLFVISDVPGLWRLAEPAPEGAELAIYAPSDNNATAERLLIKREPLDATASNVELVEDATNDLEDHYDVVFVTQVVTTEVGFQDTPAQRIDFNWNQGFETGAGYRWVIPGQTEVVYVTYIADLDEPERYIEEVEAALDTAAVGG